MAGIAINGLERIGRTALKILEQAAGAEAVAVNDLVPPDNLAYLLATAIRDDDPVLVLENLALYNTKGRCPTGSTWRRSAAPPYPSPAATSRSSATPGPR